jgi:hypothetical protein
MVQTQTAATTAQIEEMYLKTFAAPGRRASDDDGYSLEQPYALQTADSITTYGTSDPA